ncbi:MAG: hypothetical protein IPN94_24940 [Sphingobacteriales bacterium]|nr:hypothetical protein [Sphingobacteriales bacterium]
MLIITKSIILATIRFAHAAILKGLRHKALLANFGSSRKGSALIDFNTPSIFATPPGTLLFWHCQ